MSVSELIKTALPVAATQGNAASIAGTPTKMYAPAAATTTTATALLQTNSNSGTPNKSKNQPSIGDKVETMEITTTTTASAASANAGAISAKAKISLKTPEEFYKDLQMFHEKRGTPIADMPKISGRLVDLVGLYSEVTERGGFHKVNTRDEWDEVLPVVGLRDKCVNASAAVKHIYRRFLEKYERLTFFGEDPDKMEAMEAADALESGRSRSARYPSMHGGTSNINSVPMSYNYRQHVVNMDRRRTFRLSTDLHKHSNYEKLMLSLISPLPNEQDFAINVCTLMANESKLTLKLAEYPKLVDLLLAHAGVYADCTLRQLFEEVYVNVRKCSLYSFWRDLLHDKPLILDLYTDEQALSKAGLVIDEDKLHCINSEKSNKWAEYLQMEFFNLGRGHGTQDLVGQRVQQIINILRNLSFFEEHTAIFAKNRTLLRFLVMSSYIRWGTLHIQALDIIGNIALELDLMDPSTDDLSRSLMSTLCDGIEGEDRAVIINCLEILYKICQKDSNEDYINKCLNLKFYETICLFLSLNDIMLLIFTLEAIYALTSMGARSCHIVMQVRGIIDQLVSLISVEAQAYGPDGCILMRVVETVPGNMLPMVAQNIANLQNVQQQQQLVTQQPTSSSVQILNNNNNNNNNNNTNKLVQQPNSNVVTQTTQQPQQQPQQQTSSQLQQQPLPKLSQSTAAAAAIILQQQAQILQQPLSQTNQATLQQQQQQQQQLQQKSSQIAAQIISNSEQQKLLNQPSLSPSIIKPTLPTVNVQQLQQHIQSNKSIAPAPNVNQQVTTNTSAMVTSSTLSASSSSSPTTTTAATSTASLSTNQFTQDDDQYAMAWLAATFERAGGVESRIEQQDLYRMYLTHSQKAGKHSVVNHMQFPRLVRTIFGNNIGPAIVRRVDGTEYPGIHYVAIKMRAHPLPIQVKVNLPTTTVATSMATTIQQQTSNIIKTTPTTTSTPELKKFRKKPSLQQSHSFDETTSSATTSSSSATPTINTIIRSSESSITSTINSVATNTATTDGARPTLITNITSAASTSKPIITSNIQLSPALSMQQQQQQQPPPLQHQQQYQQGSSSSLIKSLLANKVNQRQQKQKEQITTQTPTLMNQQQQQQHKQPIKVTSNSISALVNNPLMQNTPVKVGQTTIKPLNPQLTQIDKKNKMESSVPPPLAPLSGNNVVKDTSGRSMIIANQMLVDILDKKTIEPPLPTNQLMKRKLIDDSDKMNISGGQTIKRLAYDANGSVIAVVANPSISGNGGNNNNSGSNNQIAPSKNAANLYAEMAASILEDEDLDDIPTLLTHSGNNNTPVGTPSPAQTPPQLQPQQQHQQSAMIGMTTDVANNQSQTMQQPQQQQQQQIYVQGKMQQNIPRQMIFQQQQQPQQQQQQQIQIPQLLSQQHQLKLGGQPTAMATIKTDQGLQTVPVILQQKPMDQSQPQILIQSQQQQQPTHTTQYVLATNQQGQTYLVAQQIPTQQQPPPPQQQATQTMLLTQTPQHGAGTKTIIIVQQQQQPQQQQQHQQLQQQQQQQQHQTQLQGSQKVIMTTQQGQQVLLTQRTPASTPTPPPSLPSQQSTPIIINPGTGIIQRQFQAQQQQPSSGQISPTLLSQLNHIPATIKLHQPSVICSTNSANSMANSQTTATITRVAKPISAMPMQIPQLQQHSSIIQQHIISAGGSSGAGTGNNGGEKRQVILTGGRAIEIKETVITNTSSLQSSAQQQQQHLQTPLLNSQRIISQSSRPSQGIESTLSSSSMFTTNTAPIATTSVAIATPTSTSTIIQQNVVSNLVKPGLGTTVVSSGQSATAPVIVTQSSMGKKATGISTIQRPMVASGVIKTSSTVLHGGIIASNNNNNNNNGGGPPPLAVQSSKVEDLAKSQIMSSKTPTPPLQPSRTPTPSTTNSVVSTNVNTTTNASTTIATTGTISTTATTTTNNNKTTPTSNNLLPTPTLSNVDINWPYVCDWRNCQRRKFKSLNDLQQHACTVHCPEHLDPAAEIFCQWGIGPGLCDGIPRKRYSLMTHLIDRHITIDALRQAVQRRISAGASSLLQPTQPPVTIIRNMSEAQRVNTASPALSSSSSSASTSSSVPATGSSALQAIQRHTADFMNSKELMDENEGPVTKSIRLTAALILRNLVTYTNPAKRSVRRYEQHLSNIALSNVESSGTIAHILFELNN